MCLECDGYSHEEVMLGLDRHIRTHGWALIHVADGSSAFSYTVGLVENFGHPDLIILDAKRSLQRALLARLANEVAAAGRIPDLITALERIRYVDVHPHHLRPEYFAMWAERHGRLPAPGEVLQVLLPDESFCACHVDAVTRLDLPGTAVPPPRGPNRAARRQRKRGGHAA